ncbi:MAG: PAS domain-containing protein, partial [Thermomicrobiales bacterium]|nr:PAS domain-containing protein [Thermomicrobiales bacterium]
MQQSPSTSVESEPELPRLTAAALRALVCSSPLGAIVTTCADGRIVDANEIYARLLGSSRGDLVGRTASDLELWAEPAQGAAVRAALLAGEPLRDAEVVVRGGSGDIHYLQVNSGPIDVDGTPAMLTFVCDTVVRRRLESELRAGGDRLRLALDNAAMGVWEWNIATG